MTEPENNQTDSVFPPVKFYTAVLTADGEFSVHEFDTVDDLQHKLKSLVDKDATAFNFAGMQLKISKGPFRYLLTPWGNKPLFTEPGDNFEVDDTGYLGHDAIHLQPPAEIVVPEKRSAPQPLEKEFFPDDDENIADIFDKILPDPDS
ncbi:hypothetical protein EBZ39_03465 [bacterium]|nr:hypothetical protein [bacterium]